MHAAEQKEIRGLYRRRREFLKRGMPNVFLEISRARQIKAAKSKFRLCEDNVDRTPSAADCSPRYKDGG